MWKRTPAWLRPPLWGALALLGTVGMPMLAAFALFPQLRVEGELREASRVLSVAVAAGAVGGLAFSFVGAPLLRIPFAGRPLAGIACVLPYLGFGVAASERWTGLHQGWETSLLVGVGFGILVGFFLPRTWPPLSDRRLGHALAGANAAREIAAEGEDGLIEVTSDNNARG